MSKILTQLDSLQEVGRPFLGNGETEIVKNADGTETEVVLYNKDTVYLTNEKGEAVEARNAEALLRYDEWKQIDRAVLETQQEVPAPLSDWFITNGLTYTLSNALGTPELSYQVMSDMQDAVVSMDGLIKTENDTVSFDMRTMPTPLVIKDFEINTRRLMASRKNGEPLDTLQARIAARKVREARETLFVSGDYSYGSGTLQGITTFDYRMTGGTSENKWTKSGKTGADILNDVQTMIAQAEAKFFNGPYVLFVCKEYKRKLNEDYSTNYPNVTIKDRLLKDSDLVEIVFVPSFDSDVVVLMQKSAMVGQAVLGIPMTVVQEVKAKGFLNSFRVMEMTLPRFYADKNGAAGIVHWTLTDA